MLARRRQLIPLLGVLAAAACAPAAGAFTVTGTLTPPVVSADGTGVTAQVTMTSSCVNGEYCGFFPEVTTVVAPQACAPTITGSTWVGPVVFSSFGDMSESLPPTTASWHEWPSLASGSKTACLYAEGVPTGPTLVAQTAYTVPTPAPVGVVAAPTVTPAPTATPPASTTTMTTVTIPIPDLPTLTRADAIAELKRWVLGKYGHRWTRGRGRTVRCPIRSSTAQLGCLAVWTYHGRMYSKSVVLTLDEYGDFTISRDFASAPPQTETIQVPVTTPGSGSGDFCTTHDCIPNYPNGTGTTVQCADGTYSHSGGRRGACSYHGGEAGVVVPRRDAALTFMTLRAGTQRLSASRR